MHSPAHPRLSDIVAKERSSTPLGIVYPCDAPAMSAAHQIASLGIAKVFLIGPAEKIKAAAAAANADLSHMTIVDTVDDPKITAATATKLVRDGKLAALMKGSLHTDELMAAAVNKETGLRTPRRIGHVIICDVPAYHKLLSLTDCVVNIAPTLDHKKQFLFDAITLLQRLGIQTPKVAIVAAVESVNPAMVATTDAAALVDLAKQGEFPASMIEGPFGFDNAISKASAKIKGIQSDVAGDPDLLLLPDLEAANILFKSLVYMGGAACAGIVTGVSVPIALISRSDSTFSRVASAALAVRAARHSKEALT
jgi:phosphate acetyltransferase